MGVRRDTTYNGEYVTHTYFRKGYTLELRYHTPSQLFDLTVSKGEEIYIESYKMDGDELTDILALFTRLWRDNKEGTI